MKNVYRTLGTTKQAFHQKLNREMNKMEEQQQLLPLIDQLRRDHPRMSAKKMYQLIKPQTLGRDYFISLCYENGYRVPRKRSPHRTTNSSGVIRFPNLLKEMQENELTSVNQVWVSDITYYRIGDNFCYITLITDLYSRRIIGWGVSKTLMTCDTTLPALIMARKQRKPNSMLILHSDGGGQYYSKDFTNYTEGWIKNSMGKPAYENPHAERIIGTIKNEYVKPYGPKTFTKLKRMMKKAVEMYNYKRPHNTLNSKTPVEYEEEIHKISTF